MKPLADRVAIVRDEAVSTAGQIILPNEIQPTTGTVVEAGEGRITEHGYKMPMTVKVGDKVLYASKAGTPVNQDGKKLLMLREVEIRAILEREANE